VVVLCAYECDIVWQMDGEPQK